MIDNEARDKTVELLNAVGAWGLEDSDTDDVVFRIVGTLFSAGALDIVWESESAEILADIAKDNWAEYLEWKERVL